MADIDTKNIRGVAKRTMLICLLPICVLCRPDSSDKNEGSRRIEKSEKSIKDSRVPEIQSPVHTLKKPTLNVIDFGALGDGICDDTKAFQAAINAAVLGKSKLLIPAPSKFYKITSTLNIKPASGGRECFLDIEAQGVPRSQIVYSGTAGTAAINAVGLRFSTWTGVKIQLANVTGLIGVSLDTDARSHSTSFLSFTNCHVAMGNAVDQNGWRLGHNSGGGGDISVITWQNCSVFGVSPVKKGQIGWHIEGPNALQNVFVNAFGAYLDKMYSNVSSKSASATGNGAVYFYGTGTSQNNTDFEIGNSQSYLISGGRFESGKRVLSVTNSNVSPSIIFQATEIDDYNPSDGILFYLDMPLSLKLDGCNIKAGTHPAYTKKMITCYGGGNGTGIGRLNVSGGSIEASDPFYSINLNSTVWMPYILGVGKQNNAGVNTGMMKDHLGSLR